MQLQHDYIITMRVSRSNQLHMCICVCVAHLAGDLNLYEFFGT